MRYPAEARDVMVASLTLSFHDGVGAIARSHEIGVAAIATDQPVPAPATVQGVVAPEAIERIPARVAGHYVVCRIAVAGKSMGVEEAEVLQALAQRIVRRSLYGVDTLAGQFNDPIAGIVYHGRVVASPPC